MTCIGAREALDNESNVSTAVTPLAARMGSRWSIVSAHHRGFGFAMRAD